MVQELRRKLTQAETQALEAGLLATAAMKRCEAISQKNALAMQERDDAVARATEVEKCLAGLQQAIAFEFSNVLA